MMTDHLRLSPPPLDVGFVSNNDENDIPIRVLDLEDIHYQHQNESETISEFDYKSKPSASRIECCSLNQNGFVENNINVCFDIADNSQCMDDVLNAKNITSNCFNNQLSSISNKSQRNKCTNSSTGNDINESNDDSNIQASPCQKIKINSEFYSNESCSAGDTFLDTSLTENGDVDSCFSSNDQTPTNTKFLCTEANISNNLNNFLSESSLTTNQQRLTDDKLFNENCSEIIDDEFDDFASFTTFSNENLEIVLTPNNSADKSYSHNLVINVEMQNNDSYIVDSSESNLKTASITPLTLAQNDDDSTFTWSFQNGDNVASDDNWASFDENIDKKPSELFSYSNNSNEDIQRIELTDLNLDESEASQIISVDEIIDYQLTLESAFACDADKDTAEIDTENHDNNNSKPEEENFRVTDDCLTWAPLSNYFHLGNWAGESLWIEDNNDTTVNKTQFSSELPERTHSNSVWHCLRSLEDSNALQYKWMDSNAYKYLLSALNMNAALCRFGNPNLPAFASQLGVPLTPMSVDVVALAIDSNLKVSDAASSSSPDDFTSSKGQSEACDVVDKDVVPPVEFDWTSSGLINPLSEGGSILLDVDLDYFQAGSSSVSHDYESADSTLRKELQSLGLDDIDEARSTIAQRQLKSSGNSNNDASNAICSTNSVFDSLMKGRPGNNSSALVSSVSSGVRSNTSDDILNPSIKTEVATICGKLPDLSFMLSPMLMFPIRNMDQINHE